MSAPTENENYLREARPFSRGAVPARELNEGRGRARAPSSSDLDREAAGERAARRAEAQRTYAAAMAEEARVAAQLYRAARAELAELKRAAAKKATGGKPGYTYAELRGEDEVAGMAVEAREAAEKAKRAAVEPAPYWWGAPRPPQTLWGASACGGSSKRKSLRKKRGRKARRTRRH